MNAIVAPLRLFGFRENFYNFKIKLDGRAELAGAQTAALQGVQLNFKIMK